MTFTTAGLANGEVTAHHRFQYDNSLQQLPTNPNGPEPDRTNLVVAVCDSDFGPLPPAGALKLRARTPLRRPVPRCWPK